MPDLRLDIEIEVDPGEASEDGIKQVQDQFEEFIAQKNWTMIDIDIDRADR